MALDLDVVIFVGFLTINLAVGLFYSRGVRSTAEYAIGDRSFSTNSLIATIIASYIGGGVFVSTLSEVYKHGLYYIIPVLGEPIAFIIMGIFFIPRMTEFLGEISVAEMMGRFYGSHARIITAISGILCASGVVALQFIIATSIMKIFFDINSFSALSASAMVIILYSSLGGIKAVTITDILQFLTFTAVIPLLSLVIWREINFATVLNTLSNNPAFDYKEVLNVSHPRFFPMAMLFIFFICPTLVPTFIQRVSMATGVKKAQKSFIVAGIISLLVLILLCSTSILLLSSNPDLNPNELLPYIINHYTYTGFKGLTAICIMAVLMSTADSYINSAAVLLMHDIFKPIFKVQNDLVWLRSTALLIGILAFVISYRSKTLLDALVMTMAFYMPIVVVPLTFAIFGLRTSGKVALIGMTAGAITVVAWMLWTNFSSSANIVGLNQEGFEGFNETVPGMFMNLVAFIIAHLYYGKQKHYTNPEHEAVLTQLKQKRKKNWNYFFMSAKNFNFMSYCKNLLPKNDSIFFLVGIFSIAAVYASTYSLSKKVQLEYNDLLSILHYSILSLSSALCITPLLPFFKSKHKKNFIAILWVMALLVLLVSSPFMFMLLSNYELFSVIALLISAIILISLTSWQIFLIFGGVGIIASLVLYKVAFFHSITTDTDTADITVLQFKVGYGLLLLGFCFFMFLKPKQEAQDLSEEKIDHLNHRVEEQGDEIAELSNLKQVFLRNLQHETNTPITGVYSMSQALQDCYDKLTDQQRKNSIDTIVTSSERLISYANNLIDVSKLTSRSYIPKMKKVNLSNLLEECIRKCKRLYIHKNNEEDREISIHISSGLTSVCDEYYIRKSFENLLINAIQYCKKGKISITLSEIKNSIRLVIQDSGIGIPKAELGTIFDPFVTSSKTITPAGGRGVGLSVVRATAEAHKATITAESDGENGSTFTMILPIVI